MPGRGLPPSSRSMAWASTVLPAPVSPVRAFRPGPRRSSARSISSRFSTRSSWSIARRCTSRAGRIRSPPPPARVPSQLFREPPEALAQAVVEARPRELGERREGAPELDVDVLASWQLAGGAAVHAGLDRVLSGRVLLLDRVVGGALARARGQRVRGDEGDDV